MSAELQLLVDPVNGRFTVEALQTYMTFHSHACRLYLSVQRQLFWLYD